MPARRVGLALGSGGARGWAHIGVIRALEEAGVKVECAAGASMGAIVGAAFAAGRLDELEVAARRVDWKEVIYRFFELTLPRSGLVDGRKIVKFLRHVVGPYAIEELKFPFACVATDVETGEEVILREGDLLEAIRASISIPGIFTPVRRQGRLLVDGGVVNPVPVNVARSLGADFIIAVDVRPERLVREKRIRQHRSHRPRWTELSVPYFLRPLMKHLAKMDKNVMVHIRRWQEIGAGISIFDVLGNAIAIMQSQITDMRLRMNKPDLIIHPRTDLGILEFHRGAEAIKEGYAAVQRVISDGRLKPR